MKRCCLSVAALLTLLSSVGCCYRPGAINPYNGIAYGGRWEAMPGGPLDATACYGPNFCPTMPADCWNVCTPPCALPAAGPYMTGATADCCDSGATSYPQTFAPSPHVMPPGSEGVPGGMQPVPDPNIEPKRPKNGGATTYVVPQHFPMHRNAAVNQATSHPWVQAH